MSLAPQTNQAPVGDWNRAFEAAERSARRQHQRLSGTREEREYRDGINLPRSDLCLPPLSEHSWDEWLWNSDLHERLSPNVVLHKGHLLGILIARYRFLSQPEAMRIRLGSLFPNIVHGFVMVEEMSLRQMRDALEDLQMHWKQYTLTTTEEENSSDPSSPTSVLSGWDAAAQAVDALMARLGFFLSLPPPQRAPPAVGGDPHHPPARLPLILADDPASLDPERPGCLSVPAIRRFTSLLCILYRHLSLEALALDEHDDPTLSPQPHPGVENHHLQAGMEDFYRFTMMADLPPAARLIYKQDFQGMYHCVTQVVFMHYPSYERQRQLPLAELRLPTSSPLYALCILAQLCPDARIVYEDEAIIPPIATTESNATQSNTSSTGEKSRWVWMLLAGGTVYLLNTTRTRVYKSRSLWALMQKCLNETP